MPNTFAYVVLFSWPVFVILFFRRMKRPQAIIASIIGGYLLLPERANINLPVLPTFDKTLIPAFSAMVMCYLLPNKGDQTHRRAPKAVEYENEIKTNSFERATFKRKPAHMADHGSDQAAAEVWTPKTSRSGRTEGILILLAVATPFLTYIWNTEIYVAGPRAFAGLTLYDASAACLATVVWLLPYFLARRFLSGPNEHVILLRGLCVAAILYSLPTLFEIRMSPQLSQWIYGFLPQSFAQAVRSSGYRPVVFLNHGLWLAIFFAMATLSAFALFRHERPNRRLLIAALYLLGILVWCRSLGALAIALILLPLVIFARPRGQLIAAASISFIVLLYPALRGANLIPTERIISYAGSVSAQRAESLRFRLENEDLLLAHANAKPLAGWGGWGRARVYDEYSGQDISVTDGAWIIIIGTSGWLGYIAIFGLLTAPALMMAMNNASKTRFSLVTSGLCLVLATNLIDMIPNGTLTPVTWLIAGALMGQIRKSPIVGKSNPLYSTGRQQTQART